MQYSKCQYCKHNGNMCKFLVTNALATLSNLQYLTNQSLSYMRFKPENQINVEFDINCEGFIKKEN